MSRLPPAYRGAPYYQPRPPPGRRRQHILRIVLLAVIGVVLVLLVAIACASLAHRVT